MNILLLSNSAPNYFHFFNALAKCFADDGCNVTVAVDSTFSREENGLDALGFVIHDFSSYFARHKIDKKILKKYSDFNLNSALLSDFERAEVYKIWGDDVGIDFYDCLKSALLSYFEDIFSEGKIDLVLYEGISNSFAHYAFFVAKKNKVRYCGIGGSRLPGRFTIANDPLADDTTAKVFDAIRARQITPPADVRQWATEYIAKIETVVPDYMKINGLDRVGLVKRYLRRDRLSKLKSLLRHAFDSRTDAFQIGNPLRTHFNLFARNVSRRLKLGRIQRLYQESVNGERFLLYPLHFHPESATSILAGTYLDEYEVIRNIAFNLPEGIRLYVKDHISAWGFPSLNFYQRVRRLPNVRLLGPNAPTKQLIKASEGVITLTSTVGYEALLLKTRVYLYGRVFYEFHKGVCRVENPTMLHDLILRGLNQRIDWDDEYNIDFVCAYQKTTFNGSLNLMQTGLNAKIHAEKIYKVLQRNLTLV